MRQVLSAEKSMMTKQYYFELNSQKYDDYRAEQFISRLVFIVRVSVHRIQ